HLEQAKVSERARRSGSEILRELLQGVVQRSPQFTGEMGVDLGGAQTSVTEVFLDDAQIHAHLEKMSRIGVPQRVHMRALVDAGTIQDVAGSGLAARARDGGGLVSDAPGGAVTGNGGEEPLWRAVGAPVVAQDFQGRVRQ